MKHSTNHQKLPLFNYDQTSPILAGRHCSFSFLKEKEKATFTCRLQPFNKIHRNKKKATLNKPIRVREHLHHPPT
jgi:hypothetical protein